jgi:hypothetical protein
MNSIDNFLKEFIFSVFSVAKSKNIFVFAFTFVLDSFGLFYGDFRMDLYGVDSDEARRWSVKCFIASILGIVKRFIATVFISALNASSPLIFKEKHCLTLHRRYFLKEIWMQKRE